MRIKFFQHIVSFIISIVSLSFSAGEQKPFPMEENFPGCIKPNVTQASMNTSVINMYEKYKVHIKPSTKTVGGYYLKTSSITGETNEPALTCSEAHGYAMVINVLMAGYDKNAKTVFDGLYKVYKDHTSSENNYTMSWVIDIGEAQDPYASATDGDMDIAYSLILAHYQWGSKGDINYLEEAKSIITNGLKEGDVAQSTFRIIPGDWSNSDYDTRCSDWMPGHIEAFKKVTGDNFWDNVNTEIFSIISQIRTNYSPKTGLMPDFVTGSTPKPDPTGGGTGEDFAEDYYWNGCRFPWRMATAYAHNGLPEAKTACQSIITWLKSETGGDVNNTSIGYTLSGNPLENGSSVGFDGPFAAACIVDATNQTFLNDMWNKIKDDAGADEYQCALNLLSMLLISGNWWTPIEGVYKYEKPTEITLSDSVVKDQKAIGTEVGSFTTNQYGGGTTNRFELTAGGDDFSIIKNKLLTKRVFNYQNGDSVLNITVKTTDDSSNSFTKNFVISVDQSGYATGNLVHDLIWVAKPDTYGSTVDTGTALVGDSMAAIFDMATDANEDYVFGDIESDTLDESLGATNSTYITIIYKSDNKFNFNLIMKTVTDYGYHAKALPSTNGQWSTIKMDLNAATFIQPLDWAEPVTFDKNLINKIIISVDFQGEKGSIEVRSIIADGIQVSVADNYLGKIGSRKLALIKNVVPNSLTIYAPTAGVYKLNIYGLNGRLIKSVSKNLNVGTNQINWNESALSRKVLIISIEYSGRRTIQKIVVK